MDYKLINTSELKKLINESSAPIVLERNDSHITALRISFGQRHIKIQHESYGAGLKIYLDVPVEVFVVRTTLSNDIEVHKEFESAEYAEAFINSLRSNYEAANESPLEISYVKELRQEAQEFVHKAYDLPSTFSEPLALPDNSDIGF